jgi:dipeptidyl aminopeptidase/acylaminoacyl peptidase
VQGANDPRVPQAEAEQMASTVKRNGSPVWCMLAKNEGHGYRRKENSDYMFGASVMFVKRYLLGEEVTPAGW